MAKRTFDYEPRRIEALVHTDLANEANKAIEAGTSVLAFVVTIYDATGVHPEAETAEAIFLSDAQRIGIAWGADATWADADSLESGIEMWLNDGEAWSLAN